MTEINLEKFKKVYEREIVKLMRDGKVPGLSVLITQNGKILYERNFGAREWEGTKPATSDTLYGIASMTKSMTCAGILMLQEHNKLDIRDPISKYIPVNIGIENSPITIHDLMCHGSGLPNLGSYSANIKTENLTHFNDLVGPMGNWDDFYFHVNDAQDWLLSKPGEKFYYNNDGFTMLSQIIANVSGISYEQFIKENLLDPIGMSRSTFHRKELDKDDNVSKGYSTDPSDKGIKRSPKPHLSGLFNSGAGGLNSSTNEMTKYLQFHLANGKVGDKQLLSSDSINIMRKTQNNNLQVNNTFLIDSAITYGYGLSIFEDYFGYKVIRHGGASGVAGGEIIFIPELNITYCHLYNVGWFNNHISHIALYALLGKNPEDLPFLKRRRHLKRLSGEYMAYKKNIQVKVILKNGILNIEEEFIEKTSTPLIPEDPTEYEPMKFRLYGMYGHLNVEFYFHEDKSITFDYERNVMKKIDYRPELE